MNNQSRPTKSNKYQKVIIVNNPFVLMIMAVLIMSGVYIGFDQKIQLLERNNNKLREQKRELEKDFGRELANWNALASEDALSDLLEKNDYGFDMIKEDQHPNVIYMDEESKMDIRKSSGSIARINRNQNIGVAQSSY